MSLKDANDDSTVHLVEIEEEGDFKEWRHGPVTRMRTLIALAGVMCLTSVGTAAESPTIYRIKQRGELPTWTGRGGERKAAP